MTDPRTGADAEPEDTPDLSAYETADGFDFDAAYAEVAKEPFRFRWNGTWWQLPHLAELDWRTIKKFNDLAGLDESGADDLQVVADRVTDVLRDAFGERAAEFDQTPQPAGKVVMLFNQWRDHCGVDVGEAPSSNGSSGSTAELSKQTSTAGTASGSRKRSSATKKTATRRVRSSR